MIAKQAAFILQDGSIVDIDGSSNLQFNLSITDNLYGVIWHRNHLGIMNAVPLVESGGVYSYNYSTGSGQVYGGINAHKEIGTGIWGMIGADGLADGQINTGDKIDVWSVQVGNSGYLMGDYNLNGQVGNPDKVDVWSVNAGSGTQIPDNMSSDGYKCMVP